MAEEQKPAEKPAKMSNEVTDSNLLAALSYLWILSIVFYVVKKDDSYIQFHAKQGIVLFGISILGMVPIIGWPLGILSLVGVIIGAVKAYKGEKYKMPLVSDLAQKINF